MYQVEFMPEAEDDLARLSPDIAKRVLKKAQWLADNFDQLTPEALTGQWRGVFKLRVGDYRALYTFAKGDLRWMKVDSGSPPAPESWLVHAGQLGPVAGSREAGPGGGVGGGGGCLGVLRQKFWQGQMLVDAQPFSSPSEVEAQVAKVERCITLVNSPVMVGAYQGHIFQCISTPATQPVNMVCFAEVPTIHSAGAPFTYLALPLV